MSDGLPYVAMPPGCSGPPVLVIHSWWGLTTAFTAYADRLAAHGFVVACADLFDGRTATTEDEARKLRAARRREPMYKTLQRDLRNLTSVAGVTRPEVALVGFSMGGHWAVWLSQHPPPAICGTVTYYAARGGDFSRAASPYLAHFAEHDEFVSTTARRNMERAVSRAGLAYAGHDYPGTGHWFAETDQAAYDDSAADRAFERTVAFLGEL